MSDQITYALQHLATAVSAAVFDPDIPRLQAAILRVLELRQGTTTVRLARELRRSRQTVARALEAMERADLVRLKREPGLRGTFVIALERAAPSVVPPADRGAVAHHAMALLHVLNVPARMCITCSAFAASPRGADHRCNAEATALADADLRFDCPLHRRTNATAPNWEAFQR